jgi:hypothetical protein
VIADIRRVHQLAGTAETAGAELLDEMSPGLPEEDYLAVLRARLRNVLTDITACIGIIADAAPDEQVKARLTAACRATRSGCRDIGTAAGALRGSCLTERGPRPHVPAPPAALSSSDFPQPAGAGTPATAAQAHPAGPAAITISPTSTSTDTSPVAGGRKAAR